MKISSRYEVVPATLEHVWGLHERLREADVAEIWAASRLSPKAAMEEGVKVSRDTKAVLLDGRPEAIWGVAARTMLSDVGVPWMLGSVEVERHAKALLHISRKQHEEYRSMYRLLVNYVDARHHQSIRWLRWLGFEIGPAEPFGVGQLPFHRFEAQGHV